MKKLLAIPLAAWLLAAAQVEAGYAPGCTVALDLGALVHEGRALALQPDGRILVAGYVLIGGDRDFLVARYHPDLTLDTSWGGSGWVATGIDVHDQAFGVAVQTDGKVVVVGSAENGGGSKRTLAVARYRPDGSLDPSYGGTGLVTYDLTGGSSFEELFGVTIQPDGKIVAIGYHTYASVPDILVTRFLKDGNWDNTFSGDGLAQPVVGDTAYANAVAIDRDGAIAVAATGTFAGNDDFVTMRLRSDGSLDPSFAGGWVATDIANPDDEANAIAIGAGGNVIVAGTSSADFSVIRHRPDGSLDGAFDGDGIAIHDIGTDAGWGMDLDGAGNIVVAGSGGSAIDFALTRFAPNGANNLSVTHDVLGDDRAFALRVRRDGKLIVAGTTRGPGNPQLTLALYNSDGTQDCNDIALHPADDGSATDFIAFGCPANWQCPNDQPGLAVIGPASPDDGATSYVESPAGIARDQYRLTDPAPPPGKVVTAIEIVAQLARSGASNAPSAELLYQRVGFDAVAVRSATLTVTNTVYQEYRSRWSGLNWSSAELNALEIGLEHMSGNDLRLTQMYVIVTYGDPLVHPVEPFTATATGTGASGEVTLNWLNPSSGLYDETVIRRSTIGCPASPISDDAVVSQADGLGQPGTWTDSVAVGPTYYYSAFVEDSEDHASTGSCVKATPFDRTAVRVDWRYSTSEPIASLQTPGLRIATNTVITATNDGTVHAMSGGSGAGWPAGFKPFRMGAKAPDRPPVVPLPAGGWAALFGAEDGHVYAIDSVSGALVWRSPRLGMMISSSPAAMLSTFSGAHDLVFVGTRDAGAPNRLYALNAIDGTVAWYFDNGGPPNEIGIITSAPSVSYADERVYFTSFAAGSAHTVWCLDFSTSAPAACPSWPDFGVATSFGGNVNASAILFSGMLLVSDQSPGEMLYGLNPVDGSELPLALLGGAGARDYAFPHFGTLNVFASTAGQVLSVDTSTQSIHWACTISAPSAPLHVIGTNELYVGGGDGKIHRLNALPLGCPGTSECIGDCSTTVVGSPAYDFTKGMIYVGTDEGDIYGVKLPF